MCVALSRVLLLGNLAGWLYSTLIQRFPIPVMEDLDPIAALTDDAVIAARTNEGLPGDRMSTENATILTNCEC